MGKETEHHNKALLGEGRINILSISISRSYIVDSGHSRTLEYQQDGNHSRIFLTIILKEPVGPCAGSDFFFSTLQQKKNKK